MRRPNHTYSFSGTWVGVAGQSYYTHGLWQAVDGNYRFVDILDEEIALQERSSPPGEVTGDEGWPIEVKGRIPSNDLFVRTEELKSTKEGEVITASIEEGQTITYTEVPVKEFKRRLMRRFYEADVLRPRG